MDLFHNEIISFCLGKTTIKLTAGLAIKNPANKTQKTPKKTTSKQEFLCFIVLFLKRTSDFGAKVTIFLVKCV
jgi:hypothetical protein